MTHEEIQERLLDLAYGELAPRDAREVEEHAAGCDACRAELARIRSTRSLMSALPLEPAPEAGERILVAAAREAARQRAPRRTRPPWLWSGAIAAASLAAVVALSYRIFAMRPGSIGREDPRALMGESPYARPPESVQPESVQPESARPEPLPGRPKGERKTSAARPDRGEAPEPRRAAPAPAPAQEPQRFAEAPPAAAPQEPPPPERSAPLPDAEAPRAAAAPTAGAAAAPRRRSASEAAPSARAPDDLSGEAAGRSDAVARSEALRAEGRRRAEVRTFPGCDRELWRRVELDPDGRVVSYAWEERVGARRIHFEATYAPDGTVLRKRAVDAATSAPEPLEFSVPSASSIDPDAPSRCAR
jgi:hypothetical protein